MSVFLDYLSRYIDLTAPEGDAIVSRIKARSYKKGQYIVQGGEITRHQTFIVSGKVRTFYLDDNGNEHIIMFGIENWWVGDVGSFCNQLPADFNTQCLEDTKVIQLSFDDLEQLYVEVPIMERFFRLIIQRAYSNMQKRIVRNYSLSARDRYLLFCEEYPEFVQRLPQYMIASYLGITKEFLSNIRSQLSKES